MPKSTKRDIERYYFEMLRKYYKLPIGEIKYGDKPDVVLVGNRKIGIEITNFYLKDGSLIESEQIQQKFREYVVKKAQQIYQEKRKKKIEFHFGFNKNHPICNKEKLAEQMAELAIMVDTNDAGEICKLSYSSNIPEISFVYLNTRIHDAVKWHIVQVNDVPCMSWNQLVSMVKEKEKKSKNYKKCDAYWLLVIVNFWDPAQDQGIYNNNDKKIESDIFEKIFVYKPIGYSPNFFEAK